jgi:hypothetical protein
VEIICSSEIAIFNGIFFIRLVHDWEVDLISSFFVSYSLRKRQEDEDRICWIPSKIRQFEVYYHVLSILANSHFPWKSI